MQKRMAVMAGTPVDTAFGEKLFHPLDQNLIAVPISKNPSQQNFFQTLPPEKKKQRLQKELQALVEQGVGLLVVYCNSLSSAVDFDALSKEFPLHILTPLHAYKTYAASYHSLGVIAANAQGCAGIERVLCQTNEALRVDSIGCLAWPLAIEAKKDPERLVEEEGLLESIAFFERRRVEAIVFGCTHFPYFLDTYQKRTSIPCLNPDEYLLAEAKRFFTDNI